MPPASYSSPVECERCASLQWKVKKNELVWQKITD